MLKEIIVTFGFYIFKSLSPFLIYLETAFQNKVFVNAIKLIYFYIHLHVFWAIVKASPISIINA